MPRIFIAEASQSTSATHNPRNPNAVNQLVTYISATSNPGGQLGGRRTFHQNPLITGVLLLNSVNLSLSQGTC